MKISEPAAALTVGVLGALIAAGTYFLTERAKLAAASYERRSERYEQLVATAASFHSNAVNIGGLKVFLAELDQCWLYCPDTVLRAGYNFLDLIKTGADSTAQDREQAFQSFVAVIREDLVHGGRVTRTSMRPEDYRIFRVNAQSGSP